MEANKALNLLAQAASQYKGTLEEHQTLQSALQTLEVFINPPEEDKPEKKKK